MKNCNVEILFTDKETGEALLVLNLEDLNHIQENVMKAKIGLEESEKAKDKIVKGPDGYVKLTIGDEKLHVKSFSFTKDFPYDMYENVWNLRNTVLSYVNRTIENEPNLVCEDDNAHIIRMRRRYDDFVFNWFNVNHEAISEKIESCCNKLTEKTISRSDAVIDSQETFLDDIRFKIIIESTVAWLLISDTLFDFSYINIDDTRELKHLICETALNVLRDAKSSHILQAINFINCVLDDNTYEVMKNIQRIHDFWKESDYEPYA